MGFIPERLLMMMMMMIYFDDCVKMLINNYHTYIMLENAVNTGTPSRNITQNTLIKHRCIGRFADEGPREGGADGGMGKPKPRPTPWHGG